MINIISVKLWDTIVGYASLNSDNICIFQYDDGFVRSGIELSPIHMPLTGKPYMFKLSDTFQGLPGMLADSLPDKFGNTVINAWLSKNGRNQESFSVLEKLCYIGKRGMGALEYYPILKDVQNLSESIQIDQLVELCNEILYKRENMNIKEKDEYIHQLVNIGTSAGGSRAKAIVAFNEQSGIYKSGQLDAGKGFEYYLLKFGNIHNNKDKEEADDDYHTRVEYAYYLLAKKVGINISDSKLINDNGYHFLTKRFDRKVQDGKMQKIHMQTLGGLAHFDFNNPRSNSYEEVVPIMKKIGCTNDDVLEFYKRMIFNVVFRNQDDHVKNISFLMEKNGVWRLAPAYDLTLAYNPNGIWTNQHQMTICGKSKGITMDDLMMSGKTMGISERKCRSIMEEVRGGIEYWPCACEESYLPKTIMKSISSLFVHL